MPGCPNGAVPNTGSAGAFVNMTLAALTQALRDFLKIHSPSAIDLFRGSQIGIDYLCKLNPDPPAELTADDWANNLAYTVQGGGGLAPKVTEWIYEWIRYQIFLANCTCVVVTPDPALNCLHATNITLPSGQTTSTTLGTVHIEDAVYNSWPLFPDGILRWYMNLGKVSNQNASQASNWFVQFQGTDGQWVDMIRGDGFAEGGHVDRQADTQGGAVRVPRNVPLRIRTNFGSAGLLTSLDLCFRPAPAAPQPLPPDPNFPQLPAPEVQVCSDAAVCSMIEELGRQLTRVSLQVADIQAAIGSTDQYSQLGSTTIVGSNQVDVPVGTRAICVALDTLGPTVYTSALGRPRGLMRAGSVRWFTATGFTPRVFIDGEAWTVVRPQGALAVSYQLLEGTSGRLIFLA